MDNVNEEKMEKHQKKFQEQTERLKPTISHGQELAWSAFTHPDLFEKGDPVIAWKAVGALFSPTKSE